MDKSAIGRILVFRTGSLGDTLAAIPAIVAVRENFPQAKMDLLCDRQLGGKFVTPNELLGPMNIFSRVIVYPVGGSGIGKIISAVGKISLLTKLRLGRYDALVYLTQPTRTPAMIARDRNFFRLAGIRRFFGMDGYKLYDSTVAEKPLVTLPHMTDQFLGFLAADGIDVPAPGQARCDLKITADERKFAADWIQSAGAAGRRMIAVCISANMPVNVWPAERYRAVLRQLVDEFDIWPVIFGGQKDADAGDAFVKEIGCGTNAAGKLTVRQSAAVMEKCAMYLGNDTGPTHLAAAVGLRCVAIFSSREFPGRWYPYGRDHAVFRTTVDCEGCMLKNCVEQNMKCIMAIQADEVLSACREILSQMTKASK